jgi:predicted HTH transcriptional regulator
MNDGLLKCSRECKETKTSCAVDECRLWVDFEEDYNCCLVAIYEHGAMTLREVAKRLGISFARVKQIESKALKRLKDNPDASTLFF